MGWEGVKSKASLVVSIVEGKELSQQYEHAVDFKESILSQIPVLSYHLSCLVENSFTNSRVHDIF